MGVKVVELKDDSEFRELSEVCRLAFEEPDNRLMELYFPLHGDPTDPRLREASIQEAAERMTMWHRTDPTSTWVKVVDDQSGKLLGAALWHVYHEDPYAPSADGHDESHECTWFPEGEDRQVANWLMAQTMAPRTMYMRQPHVWLDILFVHPSARRMGVGSKLMTFGLTAAHKYNLPVYIDSTDIGRKLYTQFGFLEGPNQELSAEPFERTPRFLELEKRLLPFEWWPMFRPADSGAQDEVPW